LAKKSNLHQSEAWKLYLDPFATSRTNRTTRCLSEDNTSITCSLADHAECPATFARSRNRTIAWHDDRRLLLGDQLNGVAEILLMIESDIRHHCDAAIPGVHGVKATAESNLNHCPVDARRAKRIEDDPRKQLELRHWANGALHLISGAQRALHRRREREREERLTVDPNAFAIGD
jgi:hypothetical protein